MTDTTDSSVEALQAHIESAEEAYEFLISFAGQGLDHEQPAGMSAEVSDYLEQLDEALVAAVDAAVAIADEHEVAGEADYRAMLRRLDDEIEEARTVLQLLAAQDVITSAQVDNLNGMSVFQSVMMKFFFLDELTKPLGMELE
jgi:hypothetical protein